MTDVEWKEVVKGLIEACKELMKEHGSKPKGVTDWAVVNDAMVAGESAIRSTKKLTTQSS